MQLIKQLLQFRPSKLDLMFAVKTYIAAILSLFIAFQLDLLNPMWAIGTTLIIANPYSGMLTSKAVYRLMGTTIGGVVSIVFMPQLINMPWLFSVVIAGWVGFCLYISLLDRTPRSYLFMLSGYTVAMVVFNSINTIDTHNMFDVSLGRFLETVIAVICSAVVTAVIFPVKIAPIIQQRIQKNIKNIEQLFAQILQNKQTDEDYTACFSNITRDMTDLHAMAVHLRYEKSDLKGMTKPLQEMLHQLSLALSYLVAMSERLHQLNIHTADFDDYLSQIQSSTVQFLKENENLPQAQWSCRSLIDERLFHQTSEALEPKQKVIFSSFQIDLKEYIQHIQNFKYLWNNIQRGEKNIPETMTPLTTKYPSLHRDHGVAVRGGIAAFMATFVACAVWIITGWKSGYMLAQMAAICACILTAIDNPVPVLKVFLWGSVVACSLVFIYLFGIFPNLTEFWQLALVLAPPIILFSSLIPTPSLMPLGMVLGINTIMGLNLQNRTVTNAVIFLDTSFAMVLGVLISLLAIYFIRAMTPEVTAKRILAQHNRALLMALYLKNNEKFKIHLRSMLDRIGVLNTKAVQSAEIKRAMNLALIETSAAVDLTELNTLLQLPEINHETKNELMALQQGLKSIFLMNGDDQARKLRQIQMTIQQLKKVQNLELNLEPKIMQMLLITLNNIEYSILHTALDLEQCNA